MATFRSLGEYRLQLTELAAALDGKEADRIAKLMGDKAQQLAARAASGDLGGDPKFSGWAPVLATQLRPTNTPGITIMTPTRSSAGPWTVAESGRNQGNASGVSGPGISQKTGQTSRTKSGGLRKVSARAGRRWNGTTRGKRTASDAQALMAAELPKIAEVEFRRSLAKFFDVD